MVRLISQITGRAGRYMVIAVMAGALVSCGSGGSAGDEELELDPIGERDLDNDGLINDIDEDDDNDGLADLVDPFTDRDGDDLDDDSLLSEADATSTDDLDANGDGFTDVSASNVCGSESGSDNNSSTSDWSDNCTVERTSVGGQFADSLFAVGIQRVVYCSGFGTASSYTAFADGEYGPNSEQALMEFQNAEGLTDDGIVGEQTWGALQDRVELLEPGIVNTVPDAYGFSEGRCAGTTLFYQSTTSSVDSDGIVVGGWELARNNPNEAERIPFSYELPFGRL